MGDLGRSLRSRLETLLGERTSAALLVLALVVGLASGLAAAGLIWLIELLGSFVEWVAEAGDLGRTTWLLAIPLGLLAVWAVAERVPAIRGSGVPATIEALEIRSGVIPASTTGLKAAATAVTLGVGGSAGREGPTVMVGAGIGSAIGRATGLGEDQVRSLVAAGAGAGIAASFNAPIAGMLFSIEVILGNFAIRHLNAVVVASVAAAVTARSVVSEERFLTSPPHSLGHPSELVLYAALGAVAAGVAYIFLRSLDVLHGRIPIFQSFPWLRPLLLGGVVSAAVAIDPTVLGTGQTFIEGLLRTGAGDIGWSVLGGLVLLKIVATVSTIGAHGSGGHFMPALFIGSALGAGFADLAESAWGITDLDGGAFAVVGMAATFAAAARAPLTAILIVFEMTGDYGLVLPLMLAASLATWIADRIHRESVYTIPLVSRGIRLMRRSEVDLLDTVTVGEVMRPAPIVIRPEMTTREVQGVLDRTRRHGLPVVGERGDLIGIITVSDISRTGGPSDEVSAGSTMTPTPVTITPAAAVSTALERMASTGVGRLPVVDEHDPTRLVGMFRREAAIRAYHYALDRATESEMRRRRWRLRFMPDVEFFEFGVPAGSRADGRLLKDVQWPDGCTLVAVRRGHAVLVPDGSTRLQANDIITGFGTSSARALVSERLRARPEQAPRVDGDAAEPGAPVG